MRNLYRVTKRLRNNLKWLDEDKVKKYLNRKEKIHLINSLVLFILSSLIMLLLNKSSEAYWEAYSVSLILWTLSIAYMLVYGFYTIYKIKGISMSTINKIRKKLYEGMIIGGLLILLPGIWIYFQRPEYLTAKNMLFIIVPTHMFFILYFKYIKNILKNKMAMKTRLEIVLGIVREIYCWSKPSKSNNIIINDENGMLGFLNINEEKRMLKIKLYIKEGHPLEISGKARIKKGLLLLSKKITEKLILIDSKSDYRYNYLSVDRKIHNLD